MIEMSSPANGERKKHCVFEDAYAGSHVNDNSSYKLLGRKGFLDEWYKYENERQMVRLKEWCRENNIEING